MPPHPTLTLSGLHSLSENTQFPLLILTSGLSGPRRILGILPEMRGACASFVFYLGWKEIDVQSSFLSSDFSWVSGNNFQIVNSLANDDSKLSLQMTAAQSPLRLQMAMGNTQFATSVRTTTGCAQKEMVRCGQLSLCLAYNPLL